MEVISIIITSLGALITLFLLTKLMGYREMSQLSMFDYINSITIGSIAAEMATSLENDFVKPLTAMVVFALFDVFLSIIKNKSIKLRRFVEGKPVILYFNGTLYKSNLKKAKIAIGEFLEQCRVNGYFDLSTIYAAVLEANGKLSILPKESERPVAPKDLQLSLNQASLNANVIIDGHVMPENLRHTGKNEKWLMSQLSAYGISQISEVLLATCDADNKISVYKKVDKEMKVDLFL